MNLAVFDLSGIQDFIFQTNKLKEIAGASYLVSRALFENVPALLEEKPDGWKHHKVGDFRSFNNNLHGRTVYIGGGNAMVLFQDSESLSRFTFELKKKVFEQTGGALRLNVGSVEIVSGNSLSYYYEKLFGNLALDKQRAAPTLTARGFSLNELDNDSLEPVLYFPGNSKDAKSRVYTTKPRKASRGQYLKLSEYETERLISEEKISHPEGYSNYLTEQFKDRVYKTELHQFFNEDDEYTDPNIYGKRFIAVVHIDGNSMGKTMLRYIKSLVKSKNLYHEVYHDLVKLCDLSKYITKIYSEALQQMVTYIYGEAGDKKELSFRPIIADGDDITFICRSEVAFKCYQSFLSALHSYKGEVPEGMPRPKELSVGAGVAFANYNYPFSSAYNIAEELCKNAKAQAIVRERNGIIDYEDCAEAAVEQANDASDNHPISSIDFHVCYGELISDIDDYRSRFYLKPEYQLSWRPYHSSIKTDDDEFSFDHFIDKRLVKLHDAIDNDWIARSKLKELYSAYNNNYQNTVLYGKYISGRDLAIQKSKQTNNQEQTEFITDLADVFVDKDGVVPSSSGNDGNRKVIYAKYFDALEVLDITSKASLSTEQKESPDAD
ncbi:MAG: hypothetical protein FWH40_02570 [Coriobacteriia bacterium]|nr:hypothetical protein [Coriobacteriia bacterium]